MGILVHILSSGIINERKQRKYQQTEFNKKYCIQSSRNNGTFICTHIYDKVTAGRFRTFIISEFLNYKRRYKRINLCFCKTGKRTFYTLIKND